MAADRARVSSPSPTPAPSAGPGRSHGPMGGGPGSLGMTLPDERAKDLSGSLRRVAGLARPDRFVLALIGLLAALSVSFSVTGPRLLGEATNIIFAGVIGQDLPPGMTLQEVADELARTGDANRAAMLSAAQPTDGVDFDSLARVLALAVVVYALASLFSWLQFYLMAGVTQRTMFRLREEVDHKLGRLPLNYFDSHPRGDLLSRVTNDIDNISMTLQQTMTQAITALFTVVAVLSMMIYLSPLLAVISLITVPLSFLVTVLIARRSRRQFSEQWEWTGTLNGHVEEMFSGHEIVRLYGYRDRAIASFEESNERMYAASFRAQFISGIIQPSMQFISNLNYVAIAVVGGLQVATGGMRLGDVQAFIQYSRQFSMPITQLASITNLLQSGAASAERVFEMLDEPEESPELVDDRGSDRAGPSGSPGPSELSELAGLAEGREEGTSQHPGSTTRPAMGAVSFRDVTFGYRPDLPVIRDLSFSVAPGEVVAIVGPTGAGKTTLVNLLLRFYEVDQGSILLDGVDISQIPRDALRQRFGMVLQDTWLFRGTIWDNIAYGWPAEVSGPVGPSASTARPGAAGSPGPAGSAGGPSREDVLVAARAARVDDFVRMLPDGYETLLDDAATNISTGEKQLITIARAFLADPDILILDEATSAVDSRTEALIQSATTALREDRTSLVIAHRLSTIRDADLILAMDAGRIIEQGSHDELLARRGFYHRLFTSQFQVPEAVSAEPRDQS